MTITKKISIVLLAALFLAGCGSIKTATPAETPIPKVTYEVVTASVAPTQEVLPTSTSLPAPTATTAPAATVTAAPTLPSVSMDGYLDDRSTPASLILSFVNAINRHEYIRAYSYWPNPNDYLGSLNVFTNNMSLVASESVTLGQVTSEGAAGSIYSTVPAAVTDQLNGGGKNKYAVCFILQFPEPGNYGAPPITPLHFYQYTKTQVNVTTSDADAIASACTNSPGGGMPGEAASVENLTDMSSNNYIDNRSGPIELISSLINALNRKEYVRAYSYWENPATSVGSYNQYAAGFNDTGAVTAIFGTPTSDVGAGQLHYQLPMAMKVTTTSNSQQTFVGCYTMHLGNPGMQAILPFQPLAITAGKFTQVSNNADLNSLIASACQ